MVFFQLPVAILHLEQKTRKILIIIDELDGNLSGIFALQGFQDYKSSDNFLIDKTILVAVAILEVLHINYVYPTPVTGRPDLLSLAVRIPVDRSFACKN